MVRRDVTAMMALQLKNGDATYYQSAEYCRNYTSPPVSYGDNSHYLNRLPGKERLCHAGSSPPPPLTVSSRCALVCRQRKNLTSRDFLKMLKCRATWMLKPVSAWFVLLSPSLSCHLREAHHPSSCSVCTDAAAMQSKLVETL